MFVRKTFNIHSTYKTFQSNERNKKNKSHLCMSNAIFPSHFYIDLYGVLVDLNEENRSFANQVENVVVLFPAYVSFM